jgi:uncharacterized membrane protein YhiD involved in acid resistance
MMAIGDSLARGLGILGALAIIRFRYRFDNPKNIIYIFASLAIGIACGVYGFAIALSGTVIFSLVAFALYFSPLGRTSVFEISLSFMINNIEDIQFIESVLSENCDMFKRMSISTANNLIKYEYQISLKEGVDRFDLFKSLKEIDYISNIRINNRASVDRV